MKTTHIDAYVTTGEKKIHAVQVYLKKGFAHRRRMKTKKQKNGFGRSRIILESHTLGRREFLNVRGIQITMCLFISTSEKVRKRDIQHTKNQAIKTFIGILSATRSYLFFDFFSDSTVHTQTHSHTSSPLRCSCVPNFDS